jgi:hypothetical protein
MGTARPPGSECPQPSGAGNRRRGATKRLTDLGSHASLGLPELFGPAKGEEASGLDRSPGPRHYCFVRPRPCLHETLGCTNDFRTITGPLQSLCISRTWVAPPVPSSVQMSMQRSPLAFLASRAHQVPESGSRLGLGSRRMSPRVKVKSMADTCSVFSRLTFDRCKAGHTLSRSVRRCARGS